MNCARQPNVREVSLNYLSLLLRGRADVIKFNLNRVNKVGRRLFVWPAFRGMAKGLAARKASMPLLSTLAYIPVLVQLRSCCWQLQSKKARAIEADVFCIRIHRRAGITESLARGLWLCSIPNHVASSLLFSEEAP